MTTETLLADCQAEISRTKEEQHRLHNRIRWVGTLRLILFLTALLSISFYIAGQKYTLLPVISAVALVLFLMLVKYHTRLFTRYSYGEVRLSVCQTDQAHLCDDESHVQRCG